MSLDKDRAKEGVDKLLEMESVYDLDQKLLELLRNRLSELSALLTSETRRLSDLQDSLTKGRPMGMSSQSVAIIESEIERSKLFVARIGAEIIKNTGFENDLLARIDVADKAMADKLASGPLEKA